MQKARICFFIVLLNLVLFLFMMDQCNAGLDDLAKEISGEIEMAQARLKQSTQVMRELSVQNETDLNNKKLYEGTLKQFRDALAPAIKRAENWEKAKDSLNHRVESWNAQWTNRKLTPGEAAVAQRDKEKLEGELRSLDNIHDNIEKELIAGKRKIDPINKEIEAINARVQARSAKIAEIKINYGKWQKRLEELQKKMGKVCKNAAEAAAKDPNDMMALEALKYCHSINWDNAPKGLPPLTNPPPPSRVTPN